LERWEALQTVVLANTWGAKLTVEKLLGEKKDEDEGVPLDVLVGGDAKDAIVARARARAAKRKAKESR
jgi:hypothetical protein